jgi:hypothetical protein
MTAKPEEHESGPIPLHNRIDKGQNAIGLMNVASVSHQDSLPSLVKANSG